MAQNYIPVRFLTINIVLNLEQVEGFPRLKTDLNTEHGEFPDVPATLGKRPAPTRLNVERYHDKHIVVSERLTDPS